MKKILILLLSVLLLCSCGKKDNYKELSEGVNEELIGTFAFVSDNNNNLYALRKDNKLIHIASFNNEVYKTYFDNGNLYVSVDNYDFYRIGLNGGNAHYESEYIDTFHFHDIRMNHIVGVKDDVFYYITTSDYGYMENGLFYYSKEKPNTKGLLLFQYDVGNDKSILISGLNTRECDFKSNESEKCNLYIGEFGKHIDYYDPVNQIIYYPIEIIDSNEIKSFSYNIPLKKEKEEDIDLSWGSEFDKKVNPEFDCKYVTCDLIN